MAAGLTGPWLLGVEVGAGKEFWPRHQGFRFAAAICPTPGCRMTSCGREEGAWAVLTMELSGSFFACRYSPVVDSWGMWRVQVRLC